VWTPKIEDIEKNDVWFITFNYDRLLEWKLARQIKNTYLRAKPEQHEKALSFLLKRIVHVHGFLGNSNDQHQWESFGQDTLDTLFQGSLHPIEQRKADYAYRVKSLIGAINIVCENPEDKKLMENAKAIIHKKDARLVFLGFSFDKRNVLKFDLDAYLEPILFHGNKDMDRNVEASRIIGTAIGIKRGERSTIETMFKGKIALGSSEMDAVSFCRTYIRAT
jgi:hypothetical protein